MDNEAYIIELTSMIEQHWASTGISLGLIIVYFVAKAITFRLIKQQARRNQIDYSRQLYIRKLSHFILVLLITALLGLAWEISLKGLSLYFASFFTVVGVALFATWSILSNLTASLVLFFFYPYRIGQTIKIIDGDNSQEGRILDINLFYIKIKNLDGDLVAYPNNLAMQKAIKVKNGEMH